MKFYFGLATVLLFMASSAPVSAAEKDYRSFQRWVDQIPNIRESGVIMQGQTPEGIPCELYVSKGAYFYLSMGVGFKLGMNDDGNHYFGSFITPEENFIFTENRMQLTYSGPYIEAGLKQHVELELEVELEDGLPVKARGKSSLQPKEQICTTVALTS